MTLASNVLRSVLLPAAAAGTALVRKAGTWIGRAVKAYAGRRQIAALSHLSDHMLRDIGLERGDLRDASALPALADPTRFLVIRAVERRAARTRAVRARTATDTFREAA